MRRKIIGVVVLAAALGGSLSACGGSGLGVTHPTPTKTVTVAPKPVKATPEAAPSETAFDLAVSDVSVSLKTKSKECFGSSGCVLTVDPDFTYLGVGVIPSDKTYEITYEITGDEDGPIIDTVTLTDSDDIRYHPSVVTTSTTHTHVKVRVTGVEEQLTSI